MKTIEIPITSTAILLIALIVACIIILGILLYQLIRPETETVIELMDEDLKAKVKKLAERRIDAEYFYQAHVIEEAEYLKECAEIEYMLDDLKEEIEINEQK